LAGRAQQHVHQDTDQQNADGVAHIAVPDALENVFGEAKPLDEGRGASPISAPSRA
jgi:hypothetical protein